MNAQQIKDSTGLSVTEYTAEQLSLLPMETQTKTLSDLLEIVPNNDLSEADLNIYNGAAEYLRNSPFKNVDTIEGLPSDDVYGLPDGSFEYDDETGQTQEQDVLTLVFPTGVIVELLPVGVMNA